MRKLFSFSAVNVFIGNVIAGAYMCRIIRVLLGLGSRFRVFGASSVVLLRPFSVAVACRTLPPTGTDAFALLTAGVLWCVWSAVSDQL